MSGGDLLCRDAIATLVRQRGGVTVRPDAVSDWLASGADGAAAVIDEIGDRLASVLATLRAPATAAATSGARRTYLEVWPRLALVMVGGGLARAGVGERVAARAASAGVEVRGARHPEWLPLIGTARSAPAPAQRVLVMDGGQTSIKRGIAEFRGAALTGLRVMDPVPVAGLTASELPAVIAGAVGDMTQRAPGAAAQVMFSVACYLEGGRPIPAVRSIYEGVDPASMQSEFGVSMRLVHDGTAAWRAMATEAPSAVVMLGTWLGVGIGPQNERLRPVGADFSVGVERL